MGRLPFTQQLRQEATQILVTAVVDEAEPHELATTATGSVDRNWRLLILAASTLGLEQRLTT